MLGNSGGTGSCCCAHADEPAIAAMDNTRTTIAVNRYETLTRRFPWGLGMNRSQLEMVAGHRQTKAARHRCQLRIRPFDGSLIASALCIYGNRPNCKFWRLLAIAAQSTTSIVPASGANELPPT